MGTIGSACLQRREDAEYSINFSQYIVNVVAAEGVVEIINILKEDKDDTFDFSRMIRGLLIQQNILNGHLKDILLLDIIGMPLLFKKGNFEILVEGNSTIPYYNYINKKKVGNITHVDLMTGDYVIERNIPLIFDNENIKIEIRADHSIHVK